MDAGSVSTAAQAPAVAGVAQWAAVAGAIVVTLVVYDLDPRFGGALLLLVVLGMLNVAKGRGVF